MERRGFTLIELLIVVVIIGILAVIAIPKFSASKEKSFVAMMKSDLKNLATAQEVYFTEYNTYFNGTLPDPAMVESPSKDVSIGLSSVSAVGWAATATHAGAANVTCAIFYGNATAPAPATQEGEATCD